MTASGPALLVLMRPYPGRPGRPADMPMGRAALRLQREGVRIVIGHDVRGGRAWGWEVQGETWGSVDGVPVSGALDRLGGAEWDLLRERALAALGDVPVCNPPRVKSLCSDKLICQRHLEAHGVPMTAAEGSEGSFARRLDEWGAGYLKPRRGSRGHGVVRLRAGEPIAATAGDTLLQRAVGPGPGAAPVAIRQLAQRLPDRSWVLPEGVARVGRPGDAVVCVARGAAASPVSELLSMAARTRLADITRSAAAAIASVEGDGMVVELGADFALDDAGMPHLLEVNSVPRGHLGALAELDPARFAEPHLEACARPLRTLASVVREVGAKGRLEAPDLEADLDPDRESW